MSRDRLGGLHITIAAGGADAHLMSLQPELRMVRAALLYADSVTLLSPKPRVLRHWAESAPADPERRRAFSASGIAQKPGWAAAISLRESQKRGHTLSEDDVQWIEHFQAELEHVERLRYEQVERTLAAAGGGELELALNSGLVSINHVHGPIDQPGALADDFQDQLEELLEDTLRGDHPVYPLFDKLAWLAASPAVNAAGVTPAQMVGANEAALASRLIVEQIEAFPNASVDVVLDVRKRLEAPLVRFRAAMAQAAANLDTTGFDGRFEAAAQQVFRTEVEPALQELRESLQDLGALETLRRGGHAVAGSLGIAAAGAVVLEALIAAALVPAGTAVKSELEHRREQRRSRRSNAYFFLWRADELLNS